MKQTITSIWRHASACLFISPLALFFSAVAFGLAVSEAFANFADSCRNVGSDCHDPRDWVMLPLGIIGLVLLAIAATLLLRGLYLAGRHIHRRLSPA
jgi:hypothetical protein